MADFGNLHCTSSPFQGNRSDERRDGTYTFTLKKENLQDDLQRTLPSDIVFSRIVEGSCGPSYLASLSNSNEICHCLRSADMCECDCGDMGASMQY